MSGSTLGEKMHIVVAYYNYMTLDQGWAIWAKNIPHDIFQSFDDILYTSRY